MKTLFPLVTALLLPLTALRAAEAPAKEDAAAKRWSTERAWEWYKKQPWIVGFNFVPSTACNTTEMWSGDTFDPATIDRELGMGAKLGFNSCRVFVQYIVWKNDPEGLRKRIERFLTIAESHGISTTLVLFDDCCFGAPLQTEPYMGKQREPIPGMILPSWTPSPGLKEVTDKTVWPDLEKYVRDIVGTFGKDKRVLMWDLYNEAGNSGMGGKSRPLVEAAFAWARQAGPEQPLTTCWQALDLSDVISFHSYTDYGGMKKAIADSKKHGRPVICTEWMARPAGSKWTDLPLFKQQGVGCYNWGLVNGRTQCQFSWHDKAGTPEPKVWFHDLFRKDGTPYDPAEHEVIRKTTVDKSIDWTATDPAPRAFTEESITFSPDWTRWEGAGPNGRRLWYANTAGETATKEVAGTRIELVMKHGPDCGIAGLTVDGKPAAVAEIDTYAKEVDWNKKTVVAKNLPAGKHTVVVIATGRKAAASRDSYVQIVNISESRESNPPAEPMTQGGNAHFHRLPLGAIKPDGWLKRQLQIQAEGLTGYVDEFVFSDSQWKGGKGKALAGPPYRYISNYLEGLIPLAWQLNDERLQQKARPYIEWLLASAQPDGWFGPPRQDENEEGPTNNAEYLACALKMLIDYSEATGDARVLPLARNYLHYLDRNIQKWQRQFWWGTRAMEQNIVAYWVYEKTHDPEFLAIANRIHERAGNSWPEFDSWSKFFAAFPWDERALLERRIPRAAHTLGKTSHGVALAWAVKFPALRYLSTGAEIDRLGSLRAIEVLDRYHGQAAGRFSCDEHLAGRSPIQGTELCTVMEQAYSLEKVVEILGESAVADQLETLVYNAIPGTMTADCWAHQYDQQANQVKVSNEKRQWTNNGSDANLYGLYPNYPCCLGNMHQGWPRFVQNLWMATGDGGIAAIAYGPSVVTTALQGTTVTVREETEYPFDGRVRFVVQTAKPTRFPMVLRIPAWAAGATLKVGGEETRPLPGTWARTERTWKSSDVVELNLPMTLRVERRHHNAAAILRGPLYYSLRIGKHYNQLKSYNFRGAADWEILPTTPWNYGLEIDCNNPGREAQVVRNNIGSFPFGDRGDRLYSQQAGRFEDYSEEAPVVIKLPARRIPSWGMDGGSCADTPVSPVNCDAPVETVELVPYGCARLRITEFPANSLTVLRLKNH